RRVLALRPDHAEAEFNLGIVLQQTGDFDHAMQAYGRAVQRKPECFGRVAQAVTAASRGRLWLDPAELRRLLDA
ncbi:MAG: tetratricopeptide repeat protein, partial [Pseudomonadota bacterium]|nr:tetratricopeptide repeat protein [Pseudomonadota bacterium]